MLTPRALANARLSWMKHTNAWRQKEETMRKPTPKELFDSYKADTSAAKTLEDAKALAKEGHDVVDLAYEVWDSIVDFATTQFDLSENELTRRYSEDCDELISDELKVA